MLIYQRALVKSPVARASERHTADRVHPVHAVPVPPGGGSNQFKATGGKDMQSDHSATTETDEQPTIPDK